MKKILSLAIAMVLFAGISFAQSAKVEVDKVQATEEAPAVQSTTVYKVNGDNPAQLLEGKQAQAKAEAGENAEKKACDGKGKEGKKSCCAKGKAEGNAQAKATSSAGVAKAKSCDKKEGDKACCSKKGKAKGTE